jgi:hypothetical protein
MLGTSKVQEPYKGCNGTPTLRQDVTITRRRLRDTLKYRSKRRSGGVGGQVHERRPLEEGGKASDRHNPRRAKPNGATRTCSALIMMPAGSGATCEGQVPGAAACTAVPGISSLA